MYSCTVVQLYSDLASGQHTLHTADVWTRPALDTTVDTVDTRHQSQMTLDARASSLQLENIEFSFTFLTSR